MQKLPMNEDAFVRRLKEVVTPTAPATLVQRLHAHKARRTRRWVWAIPATATVLTLALIPLLMAPSNLSLAQIGRQQANLTQYTIINTRIIPQAPDAKPTVLHRDGDLWRSGDTYGLKDRTVSLRLKEPYRPHVIIDERTEPGIAAHRVDQLLRPGVEPKVERNVTWKGKRVHRYTIHTTYRAGREETFDQEVIVSADTNLPLQMTIMRDNKKWGDIWDYTFAKPDPKVFQLSMPEGVRVYDQRKMREELPKMLGNGPVAAILLDEAHRLFVLISPNQVKETRAFTLRLDGIKGDLRGTFHEAFIWTQAPKTGGTYMTRPDSALQIGDRRFHAGHVFFPVPKWPLLDPIKDQKTVSGSFIRHGKSIGTIEFTNVPLLRTGDNYSLLARFPFK